MRRAVRTKDLLLISLLTLVVVATSSAVHLSHVARLALEGTRRSAEAAAQEILALARHALAGEVEEPREALRDAEALRALIEAQLASVRCLVHVAIVDERGDVLVGTGVGLAAPTTGRADLEDLLALGPLGRLLVPFQEGRLYSLSVPLQHGEQPFGQIQLDVDTSLVGREVGAALRSALRVTLVALVSSFFVALLVTSMGRRPLRKLAQQIDRLRGGEYDFEITGSWDVEVRELAGKLSSLGEEIRSDRLKLLGQKATLEHVMNQLEDAVLLVDVDGRVVFHNRAFGELAGAPQAERAGQPLEALLSEDHPLVRLVEEAGEHGRAVEDLPCRLPVAGRFHESLVSVFVVDGGKRSEGLVVVIEDLGPFRTLQELADVGSRLLEMDELASGIVHDVRNPLNSMSLHLELLGDELQDATPDARHSLDVVREQIAFLDRVAAGLLEFLRLGRPRREPLDLARVVEAQARLIEAEAASLGVELDFEIEAGARVLGDADLLRRVFANLLRNALEALASGGRLRVRVACVEAEESDKGRGGTEVVATIEDDGEGMAPEVVDAVFRLHFTTKSDGHGIGLSVAKRIVEKHGGRLAIDSELGRGTRVDVYLPALSGEPAVPVEGSGEGHG